MIKAFIYLVGANNRALCKIRLILHNLHTKNYFSQYSIEGLDVKTLLRLKKYQSELKDE